tara:strand:- start:336 stop:1364 length:1029 start_codon:yes stop_codon:yes gene_type:complete
MLLIIKKISNIIIVSLVIMSCSNANTVTYKTLSFQQLYGWESANLVEPFNHYLDVIRSKTSRLPKHVKQALKNTNSHNNDSIKHFLETYFEPILITDSKAESLITGYHIFHATADYQQSPQYAAPIYKKPATRKERHYTHKEILEGALEDKDLEIAWLKDSIDVYLLMMQGSGVLSFPDGATKSVVYHGTNGYKYRSISQYMLGKKMITPEQRNGPYIKAYLKKDLARASTIIEQNPSYVFFQFSNKEGFSGAAGTPLKEEVSLALDKRYYPFHSLIWLETSLPNKTAPFRSLMVAQDTGGAIKGPQRADIFFGMHRDAEYTAGLMKDKNARLIMLRLRNND